MSSNEIGAGLCSFGWFETYGVGYVLSKSDSEQCTSLFDFRETFSARSVAGWFIEEEVADDK